MEYQKIKGKRHYIYDSVEEYHSENPGKLGVESDWRVAKEGDWVMSDDGRVVQLLKVSGIKHPNDRKNYKWAKGYVRTVVGSFINRPKTFMDTDFSQHKNRYTFSKTIKNPNKRVKQRENNTKNERIFSVNVASGMGPVKSYMDAFNEVSSGKAKKKALVLLKQERIMSEIEKGVLDVAKSLGIDHEYILSRLKRLADYSEDDNIILQSSKELGKIIGTSGSTIKQKELGVIGMFQGFTPDQIENVERKEISNGNDKREIKESSDRVRDSED
jgi:hypothetical protein